MTYTQDKNDKTNPVTLTLPVVPALSQIIAATPSGHMTFVVSEYGKPYTVEGFGKRWRKWATAAELRHCTPHGLRKAGATRAAENGATACQLMAIFGWKDIKQAERYTRRAEQKKLAADGMYAISAPDKTRSIVSNFQVNTRKSLDTNRQND